MQVVAAMEVSTKMEQSRPIKGVRKRMKRDLFSEESEGMEVLAEGRRGKRALQSPEVKDTLRALRRAAKRALELGLRTGTPVYVRKNNRIVDLTKEQRASKRSKSKRTSR